MHEFLANIANILEVDEVRASDALEDFDEWDSLSVLSIVAMIDADFGVNLSALDLADVRTAKDLYELVEQKRAR